MKKIIIIIVIVFLVSILAWEFPRIQHNYRQNKAAESSTVKTIEYYTSSPRGSFNVGSFLRYKNYYDYGTIQSDDFEPRRITKEENELFLKTLDTPKAKKKYQKINRSKLSFLYSKDVFSERLTIRFDTGARRDFVKKSKNDKNTHLFSTGENLGGYAERFLKEANSLYYKE